MGYLIDRAKERIGRVKADRATEMGVAGHQAAMEAFGSATGWKREGNSAMWQELGKQPDGKHVSAIKIDGHHPGVFTPGKGHAKIEPNVIDRHKPTEDF